MKYRTIKLEDREQIARLYERGLSPVDISPIVKIPMRTIYTELKRGETGELDKYMRPAYDPILAQKTYQESLRRRGKRRGEYASKDQAENM